MEKKVLDSSIFQCSGIFGYFSDFLGTKESCHDKLHGSSLSHTIIYMVSKLGSRNRLDDTESITTLPRAIRTRLSRVLSFGTKSNMIPP